MNLAKEAWWEAKIISDPDLELKSLISICSSYVARDAFQEIYKWATLLSERGKELKRNSAVGRANLFHYFICNHYGKHKEAKNNLHKALECFKEDDNINGKTTCYISLGNIKFHQKNYDMAHQYYQSALKLLSEENNELDFTLRQNIASVYIMQQEYLKAWDVYQRLLDRIPQHEYGSRALILFNLGFLCRKTTETAAAIQYFDEAITLTQQSPGEDVHVKANCMKAETLIEMGTPDEAYKILKAVECNAGKIQNSYLLEELFNSYLMYYEAKNDLTGLAKYQAKLAEVISKRS